MIFETRTERRRSARQRSASILALVAACVLLLGCPKKQEPPGPPANPPSTAGNASPSALGKIPSQLSQLGLFQDLPSLAPAAGVLPYAPRFERWHDGTSQVRHVRIPEGSALDVEDDGEIEFPKGTIFTFTVTSADALPGREHRRIETRVSRKVGPRRWDLVTYAWNDAGTDADLVDLAGAETKFTLRDCSKPYVLHGKVECIQCHNGGRDFVLGVNGWQARAELVDELVRRGHLKESQRPLPRSEVQGSSVEETRCIEYLQGNCTFCHLPRSVSYVQNNLDLRHWNAVENLVNKHGTRFTHPEAPFLVTPGKPAASTVYRLFERTFAEHDPARRMPPVGNMLVDPRGLKLIEAWIRSLE